jgi:hypothetical protein
LSVEVSLLTLVVVTFLDVRLGPEANKHGWTEDERNQCDLPTEKRTEDKADDHNRNTFNHNDDGFSRHSVEQRDILSEDRRQNAGSVRLSIKPRELFMENSANQSLANIKSDIFSTDSDHDSFECNSKTHQKNTDGPLPGNSVTILLKVIIVIGVDKDILITRREYTSDWHSEGADESSDQGNHNQVFGCVVLHDAGP